MASAVHGANSGLGHEDPERLLKLKECCDLLLAAGYFRARLSSLSPFDKVVGGLVWSITASGIDVEVDIIFQEHSTIGERIKLSDQIIKALVSMKCPKLLQPQQIQGLDYAHLFPVIQWLIKHVNETRRLTGDTVRAQGLTQFDKSYTLPSDVLPSGSVVSVCSLSGRYRPTRVFRQKAGAAFDTIHARTEATLLEFGERIDGGQRVDEEKEERMAKATGGRIAGKFDPSKSPEAIEAKAKADAEEKRLNEEREAARLRALQSQLSEHVAGDLLGVSVGSLVGRQAEEMKKAMEEYQTNKRNQEAEDAKGQGGSKRGQENAFARQSDALRKRLAAAQSALDERLANFKDFESRMAEQQALLEQRRAYIERINRETAKLEQLEATAANKEALGRLRQLVSMNEQLKAQEAQFKANCVAQRSALIEEAKRLESADQSEDAKRMSEIESLYESDLAKLSKIRQALAKKNQEFAKLSRALDEYPTRAELLQYERRFVELYELVAAKLAETKKYYSLYNTLNESHGYMTSEQGLLTSIIQNFPVVMKQKGGSSAFLESIEKAVSGVRQQQQQVAQQLEAENQRKERQMSQYNAFVEKQRHYFKAVKEFQEECTKNEQLLEESQANN